VLNKYGLLSRLITADGGGAPPGLAASGQLEVWTVSAWKNPIAAIARAMLGYWPARLDDPEAPLLAPDAGTGEIYGLLGIEGLTSIGDRVMQNLKEEKASLSQDPSYVFTQDGMSFSGGNMSYYNFVQDQLYAWVAQSHLLPFKKIIWSALEAKGEDQGQPVYGPSIAGRKAISKASQWFKNTIHLDLISKGNKEFTAPDGSKMLVSETERVMWLRTHADTITKINYPAKVRVPAQYSSEVKPFLIPADIRVVYKMIDEMEDRQAGDSKGRMGAIEAVRERLLKAAQGARERAEKMAMAKRVRATVVAPAMPKVAPAPVTPIVPGASRIPAQPVSPVQAATTVVSPTSPASLVPGSVPNIQQVKKPQGGVK
jgi:hypothetical protein